MNQKMIEQVKATFLDEVYIIPQEEIVYRIDQHGQRYYFKMKDGEPILKPSVTTVIQKYHSMNPFLLQWYCDNGMEKSRKILEESALYGTFIHILWARLLLKELINLSSVPSEINNFFLNENKPFIYDIAEWHKKSKQDILGFIQWVQDYQVKPIAIEISAVGEKYSGTIDLVCQITIKNESFIAIIDWKSGRKDFYEDNIIQLEGYRLLWNEKFPDKPVGRIFNYGAKDYRLPIGKTVTPYRFKEQTQEKAVSKWNFFLTMYLEENPTIELETKFEIKEDFIGIDTNIKEFIQEINPLEELCREESLPGKTPEQVETL